MSFILLFLLGSTTAHTNTTLLNTKEKNKARAEQCADELFMNRYNDDITLENFDNIWGLLGDPASVEATLTALLTSAVTSTDRSIYPHILSEIALAQGMQKKFNKAHESLDMAERALTPDCALMEAKIFLIRGKVFQQNEELTNARKQFELSYMSSINHGFDFYAIDAAHMIAIICEDNDEKIYWNERAIELANKTTNQKAHNWLGSLYNNLGQNYLEMERFEDALAAFTQSLNYRKKEGLLTNIRVAKWAIACAQRKLGRLDEALQNQLGLFHEYEAVGKNENFDMPVEIFHSLRGFVSEELAELYKAKADVAKSAYFAQLAFDDLSKSTDPLFVKSIAERLKNLNELRKQP